MEFVFLLILTLLFIAVIGFAYFEIAYFIFIRWPQQLLAVPTVRRAVVPPRPTHALNIPNPFTRIRIPLVRRMYPQLLLGGNDRLMQEITDLQRGIAAHRKEPVNWLKEGF